MNLVFLLELLFSCTGEGIYCEHKLGYSVLLSRDADWFQQEKAVQSVKSTVVRDWINILLEEFHDLGQKSVFWVCL